MSLTKDKQIKQSKDMNQQVVILFFQGCHEITSFWTSIVEAEQADISFF